MVVLVFFLNIIPITFVVALSDPPVRAWELVPGLLVGFVLVVAYYGWWRERGHGGHGG